MTETNIDLATIDRPFLVKERNIILVPDDPKFHPILPPSSRVMLIRERPFYTVRNTPRMNFILRNMGFPVLSPLYFDRSYNWGRIKPFASQVETAALLVAHRKLFILSDLGTGKTLSVLYAVDWLLQNDYVTKVLITAPLSILDNVWRSTIMQNFGRMRCIVVHGTAEKRLKLLRTEGWNVAVINHDGIKVVEDELHRINFGLVVIDELGAFRDARTDRFKRTAKLVHGAEFAAGMSGSPTPAGPWDAFAERKLIRPLGFKYTYTQYKRMVAMEVRPNVWLPRSDASKTVFNTLQPAVRFTRDQVMELKGNSTHTIKVFLSKHQHDCRKELIDNAIAQYKEGNVRADTAAVLSAKILQASLGAVYTTAEGSDDRAIIDLKNNHRIDMLMELINQAAAKVLVAVPFLSLLRILEAHVTGASLGFEFAVVEGATKVSDRHDIFGRFQDPNDNLRVILAQPSCMAHGVNLTEADTIVWYGPVTKFEVYQQFNGRITRHGQKRAQIVYHLEGSAIEQKFYNSLRNNGNIQDTILSMFETADF